MCHHARPSPMPRLKNLHFARCDLAFFLLLLLIGTYSLMSIDNMRKIIFEGGREHQIVRANTEPHYLAILHSHKCTSTVQSSPVQSVH